MQVEDVIYLFIYLFIFLLFHLIADESLWFWCYGMLFACH